MVTTTHYIYDGFQLLGETDETGTLTRRYTNEPDDYTHPIGHTDVATGESSYYHYDGQGNTRQITDENENVTDTFTYDSWGDLLARTGMTNVPFQFGGEHGYYKDEELDSYYVMARVYDPNIIRWLSVDPLFSSDSFSVYAFVYNSPVGLIDPSGLVAQENPEPVLTPGLNSWWIQYEPRLGPTGLDDCKPIYEWEKGIRQRFKANKAGPWPWEAIPSQTLQFNVSNVKGKGIENGKCVTLKFDEPKYILLDVRKFPSWVMGDSFGFNRTDSLAILKYKNAESITQICEIEEHVDKLLGFVTPGESLRLGTYRPSDKELAKARKVFVGPFLQMETDYHYINPCGICKICFENPGNQCVETYTAKAKSGGTAADLKGAKYFELGSWSGKKDCTTSSPPSGGSGNPC